MRNENLILLILTYHHTFPFLLLMCYCWGGKYTEVRIWLLAIGTCCVSFSLFVVTVDGYYGAWSCIVYVLPWWGVVFKLGEKIWQSILQWIKAQLYSSLQIYGSGDHRWSGKGFDGEAGFLACRYAFWTYSIYATMHDYVTGDNQLWWFLPDWFDVMQ